MPPRLSMARAMMMAPGLWNPNAMRMISRILTLPGFQISGFSCVCGVPVQSGRVLVR